jgi:hypothetical protein
VHIREQPRSVSKAMPALYVIWDALGIALPVPQLKGAPFAYPQYRTALGLELAF